MMKIRHIFTLLFLATLSVVSVAQNQLPLPPQTGVFTGLTRGYFFTAPVDFVITEIGVPTDASSANQSVVIITLPAPPPNFAGNTTTYTTEFLAQNVAGAAPIAVNVPITAGTVVGILGSRGANSTNSYGSPTPFNTTLLGEPVVLTRLLMQGDLQSQWPFAVSTEPPANNNNIGRVNITVAGAGAGGGACGIATMPKCNLTNCVTIACPPDVTVACIDDVVIDAADAVANSTCGGIIEQWVSNPCIAGVPGCNETVYTYVYKAVDSQGNIGCCERTVTLANTPLVVTVPPGGVVNCYEDISVSPADATVTNTCADWYLTDLPAPTIIGEQGCPGTQYIFTYRAIDVCGNVAEATRTFTEGPNSGPVVTSVPATVFCTCLGGVNPQIDLVEYTTSCGTSASVTATGPQIFGPVDCNGTVYRYTYTVTDDCNRSTSVNHDFVVQNGPPVFANDYDDDYIQFNCEDYGGESGTIDAIEAFIASVEAYTSCGVQLNVFNNFNPNNINTCINNGYNSITFRATDNCGRSSFSTTNYIVVDTEAPMIVEEAQDHWEMCNYNTQANLNAWVANRGGAEAYDGCSNNSVFWSTTPSFPTINCIGAMGTTSVTVTFNVRDNCGNTTSTTATFNALMAGNDMVGGQVDNNPATQSDATKGNGNDSPDIDLGNATDLQVNPAEGLTLYQNRPNPFKNETLISFNLPEMTKVSLVIYDINGRSLKVIEGTFNQGYNEVAVSRAELGATGVMYYRLMTDTEAITKSMLVMD